MPLKQIVRKFKQPLPFVVGVFLLWRLTILAFELVGMHLLPFRFSFPYGDPILLYSPLPQWLWQWLNFDGVHYVIIAQMGYDGFGSQVFFPLFPILIKITDVILGSYLLAALIIPNLAILLSAIIFFRLVTKILSEKIARWSILFLFFFPTSFFFGSAYTESVFLLLVLLAFYTESNLASGIFSILAAATRLSGIFLAAALFFDKKKRWWGFLAIGSLISYMCFLWYKFDKPLLFLTAQSAFANNRASSLSTIVTPPQVLFRYLKIFVTGSWQHLDYWVALSEFGFFIFAVSILFWLTYRRKLEVKYLIFAWLSLLLPTLSGTLSSMPRYLLTIFPIYIGLALIERTWIRIGILILFVLLSACFTILFTRGYFIS